MKIVVAYYPEAEDELDVEAQDPTRRMVCSDISEAVMAIGLIERHELKV